MKNKFTKSQVLLARKISRKTFLDIFKEPIEISNKPLSKKDITKLAEQISNYSIIPRDPPWWEQAIVEADYNQLWISGCGWMDRDLWRNIKKEDKNE